MCGETLKQSKTWGRSNPGRLLSLRVTSAPFDLTRSCHSHRLQILLLKLRAVQTTPCQHHTYTDTMSTAPHPTLINLPPPNTDPMTPSDAPGTPNSTTTSMSELSTLVYAVFPLPLSSGPKAGVMVLQDKQLIQAQVSLSKTVIAATCPIHTTLKLPHLAL